MPTVHEKAIAKAGAAVGAAVNFAGVWRNQLGSSMDLKIVGSLVSGKYESAVSGGGVPVLGELVGFVNGDLISFTVNWPTAAITAWVGQMINDNGFDVITTLWQMTTNIPDANEPTGMWQSIFAGTDRFHR